MIPEVQNISVEWNKVTERQFDNILKKWRADVLKVDASLRSNGGHENPQMLSLDSDSIVENLGYPYGETQGDATLAGAVYGVYRYDELVDTYVTDKNGYFLTDYYPCGEGWNIREITPSEGYLLDETVYWLGVTPGQYTLEKNTKELDVYEDIIFGSLYLIKHMDDGSTGLETVEAGAEFEVYLKVAGSYENARDTERDYLITDEHGYAGGVTTEPVMETFRSLAAPDPESTTFQITASDISPYGFSAEVTPSETTTYYTVKFMPTEEFKTLDFDQLTADINAGFDEMFATSQMFDPNTTVAQVLSTYYYKGVFLADASGLTPETACSGFVAALSVETGHVVKIHKFENITTTGKLGNINPSVELIGYWSGDDEAGQIFGQPDATRGKAITVVKYSGFDGARKLSAVMWWGEMTDVDQYPDASLWSQLKASWLEIDQSQPYSFYVVNWEEPQTAFVYAEDNDGNPGTFGRLSTLATAENKGDIQDLIDLVEQINATSKSSFALPKSDVIGKNTGLTLNAKSFEAKVPVAKTVKAEVKVAEPKPYAPSYNVSYVRPFYM